MDDRASARLLVRLGVLLGAAGLGLLALGYPLLGLVQAEAADFIAHKLGLIES